MSQQQPPDQNYPWSRLAKCFARRWRFYFDNTNKLRNISQKQNDAQPVSPVTIKIQSTPQNSATSYLPRQISIRESEIDNATANMLIPLLNFLRLPSGSLKLFSLTRWGRLHVNIPSIENTPAIIRTVATDGKWPVRWFERFQHHLISVINNCAIEFDSNADLYTDGNFLHLKLKLKNSHNSATILAQLSSLPAELVFYERSKNKSYLHLGWCFGISPAVVGQQKIIGHDIDESTKFNQIIKDAS